jgi:hypothetical protein
MPGVVHGSVSCGAVLATGTAAGAVLPFTGIAVAIYAALGVGLIALGVALRLIARAR